MKSYENENENEITNVQEDKMKDLKVKIEVLSEKEIDVMKGTTGEEINITNGDLDKEDINNETSSDDGNSSEKRKKSRPIKPTTTTPPKPATSKPNFETNQNRLALDLPNHNWLVNQLMQQKKLVSNDIDPLDENETNFENHENTFHKVGYK